MEQDATLEDFLDEGGSSADSSDANADEAADERPGESAADSPGEQPDGRADEQPGEPTDEVPSKEVPGPASEEPPGEIDRATSTMSHRARGGACAICGDVVERRWREADDLVCRDCKNW
ncbi:DUF7573 domain-containing protein [Halapricum desulfuricans]|uniref:DUF7573 domain-containing protein n=1 Tax=Halapricum desulfuricans TaxID=2841257 RepID=A0A897N6D4_9EURY|nr:hypothetical protein [Halapricum desulfuricans]QSG06619.1 Uncharacterized protein HSR121_2291 [Halapricum desulfuricans]